MFSTYFTGSFKREMVGGRNPKKLKTNRKSVLKTCDFRVAAPLLKINVGISIMYKVELEYTGFISRSINGYIKISFIKMVITL